MFKTEIISYALFKVGPKLRIAFLFQLTLIQHFILCKLKLKTILTGDEK